MALLPRGWCPQQRRPGDRRIEGVTSPGHGGAVSQPSSRGGTSGGLVSSHLPVLCPSPASLPPLPMGRLFVEPSGLPVPGLSTLLPENHTQADPVRGWGRHAPSGGPALLPSPVPSLCGLPATAPCAVPLPQPLPPPAGGGARAWAAAGLARVGSSVSEAASNPAGERHSSDSGPTGPSVSVGRPWGLVTGRPL